MKRTAIQIITMLLLPASPMAFAEEKHDHDHEHKQEHKQEHKHDHKGPNGGHVIDTKQGVIVEIVVDKERKAHLYLLDKDKKAQAIGTYTISGIAGERSSPTKLAFAKADGAEKLVSDVALPAGDHVAVILQVKSAPDAKAVVARTELHLH